MFKIPIYAKVILALDLILIFISLNFYLKINSFLLTLVTPGPLYFAFFLTLVPFWLMFILKFNKYAKNSSNQYILNQIRKSIPSWIIKFTIAVFTFGVANFIYSMASNVGVSVFFSQMSIFYTVAFAGLTGLSNMQPKICINGHEINMDAEYCPQCGVKL